MNNKNTLIIVIIIFSFFYGLYNNSPEKRTPGPNSETYDNPVTIFGNQLQNPFGALNESFENTGFPPSGWIKITPTGGTGWSRQIAGTIPVPGFNGGIIIAPPGGGNGVAFCNYQTGGLNSNNQWLITPKLANIQAGDSLTFWLRKFGEYNDNFQVKISTTTATVAAMTIVVDSMTFLPNDSGYVFHSYNIGSLVPSGSNIYIGFRQWVTNASVDGASFTLDLVKSTAMLVGVKNEKQVPSTFSLSQNYPNPFNPVTNISYSIAGKGFVSLRVYDLLGREVAVPVNEIKNPGTFIISYNASNLSSGVYYYKLQSGEFTDLKSMILIK